MENNKLYIVKHSANEFDDLGYDRPYPIYYSLSEEKAREFFEKKRNQEIKFFNEFMENHPAFENDEDYQIHVNEENAFEYYMGNWFYQYEFEEAELEKE